MHRKERHQHNGMAWHAPVWIELYKSPFDVCRSLAFSFCFDWSVRSCVDVNNLGSHNGINVGTMKSVLCALEMHRFRWFNLIEEKHIEKKIEMRKLRCERTLTYLIFVFTRRGNKQGKLATARLVVFHLLLVFSSTIIWRLWMKFKTP